MQFQGYHGTDASNEMPILTGNFQASSRSDDWLGTGAYFFIDGISNPKVNARQWAKLRAYDKKTKTNSYKNYCVINALIEVDNILELDTAEGMMAFNTFRDGLIEILKERGIKPSKNFYVDDCKICNFAVEQCGFDAVTRYEHIKLDKWSRVNGYQSRMPTCRIISVCKPDKSIDIASLSVTERGKV
ncbi:hypothetical protein [Serratia fonticola]|uniref:hypothetical protein n=1 Tax=Serratia fonticola TaxID=47917 RepID=UPI0027F3731E|nr:hypothetical protein [Serratia fonticola]MDQ7208528.1 hypothetical protein [Serratia fonticola]HBE9083097.1 hypothetical protein [Serratia fonticola]HBE9091271.1 hypothetical protein [Serratia fonticola]HBE9151652.1 hypothetical protein [Serratia fonticola]